MQAGIVTQSTKERLEALEAQKQQIETNIELALMERPVFTKDQIIAWISHFKYGDIKSKEYQKSVIDTFVILTHHLMIKNYAFIRFFLFDTRRNRRFFPLLSEGVIHPTGYNVDAALQRLYNKNPNPIDKTSKWRKSVLFKLAM